MASPITFTWTDDGVMRPLPHLAKQCDRTFVVGLDYRLQAIEDRSPESHRHYFACVNEAFSNMPEVHKGRWATSDHLRKWALIQAGYRKETNFVTKSKAEALRFAACLRSLDEYAEVIVEGSIVSHRIAKSQAMSAMQRREFQESKDGVLDVLANLIGVSVAKLNENAGRAA